MLMLYFSLLALFIFCFFVTFSIYPFFWSRSELWQTNAASYFISRLIISIFFSVCISIAVVWPFIPEDTQEIYLDKLTQQLDKYLLPERR